MEQVVADLNSKLEDLGGAEHPAGARGLRHQRERGARRSEHAQHGRGAQHGPGSAAPLVRARGSASRSPGGSSSRPRSSSWDCSSSSPSSWRCGSRSRDWNGRGSPFSSRVNLVGAENYAALLTEPGLSRQDFMISLRNTFYYVIGVVPLQTVLALLLAVIVNQKFLGAAPSSARRSTSRRSSRRWRSRSSSCSSSPAPARSTSSSPLFGIDGTRVVLGPPGPHPPRR